ncbi:MAG: hypothetical protein ACHQNT_09390 [Bacteroidia bacterium]
MTLKQGIFIILALVSAVFGGCQKDVPVLGEDTNEVVTPKDSVYIQYIALFSFPVNDPNTGDPWDETSSPIDPLDSLGPDIFFNSYNYNDPADTLDDFSFYQETHFANVSDTDTIVYYFTTPVFIPHFYDSLYLRMYDGEYSAIVDSTLMDSIYFKIGPDTLLPQPYIPYVSGTGYNGSQVIIGLQWK